jgi:small subunit ribosomal protein S16
MSVVIRLRRAGSRKRPFYHIVVADSRMRRDGRFIEMLGYYNPMLKPEAIEFSEDRVTEWIQKGAKPSETVDRLIKRKAKGEAPMSQKERKRAAAAAAKKKTAAEPEPAAAATEEAPAAKKKTATEAEPAAAATATATAEETPAEAEEVKTPSEEGETSSEEATPSGAQ